MEWITPKTDWKATDYVNIDDYNRWISNIACLRDMAVKVYKDFQIEDMGNSKSYGDYPYADEINTIERNLTSICKNTYPFAIGDQRTYYPNQATLDWEEMNRIESAALNIYNNLLGQINGKKRLAFKLGGAYF